MALDPTPRKTVVVAGDLTIDWHLACLPRGKDNAGHRRAGDMTRAFPVPGGAALIAELLACLNEQLAGTKLASFADGLDLKRPLIAAGEGAGISPSVHRSYTLWKLSPATRKGAGEKKPVWRVNQFLGLDRVESLDPAVFQIRGDAERADLVILHDANLGFRDRPDLWPKAITQPGSQPWIVLEMTAPVTQGRLWEHLVQNHADRLIVFITVDDLRQSEVQISREISWERTAQDLAWELVYNPRINSLARCAHSIISLGGAGAVAFSRQSSADASTAQCWLLFDPKNIEGAWEQDYPGWMIGGNACLAASLAVFTLQDGGTGRDILQAVQTGVAAQRELYAAGYGEAPAKGGAIRLSFPFETVAGKIVRDLQATLQLPTLSPNDAASLKKKTQPLACVPVQDPVTFLLPSQLPLKRLPEAGYWTILHEVYKDSLSGLANRIVLDGPESALKDVPLGRFGNLLTVDRREIESFRNIRALVGEYSQSKEQKPLSIAVFGAPGSGKSFGIKQVAKSLLEDQIDVLEFNLSQFRTPEDLLDAFHRVRDAALAGKLPLVFWDEFDTALNGARLGWLRYFLAPMQDGAFQEGQITHPIGRCIFVFAGGTSHNMEQFGRKLDPDPTIAEELFRGAKGPDFVSRLKGYVNILGPNRQPGVGSQDNPDPYFIIRRAILIRSLLAQRAPQIFEDGDTRARVNLDRGVLRALLGTREYRHGARSIESIIATSRLAGKTSFERSCLPSEAQLNLHVNARDFLALVQQIELEGAVLERLAEAAHDVFCDGLKRRGYQCGAERDDEKKLHPALIPYADLPEELKNQNRDNVRDIPNKLAVAGYVMVHARSNEPPFDFPGDDLERLAEAEHDRWMRVKLEQGWRYAAQTDREKRTNSCLLPWRAASENELLRQYGPVYVDRIGRSPLPEVEKEKDRDLVRDIPRILARAGYAILKYELQ